MPFAWARESAKVCVIEATKMFLEDVWRSKMNGEPYP